MQGMFKYLFVAAALLPLGGCFQTNVDVLPTVGVRTDLQTGVYRCVPEDGKAFSIRVSLQKLGDRYRYVAKGKKKTDVAYYALQPVSGNIYLAAILGAESKPLGGAVVLRVDSNSVDYIWPPRELVESIAPRYKVSVKSYDTSYALTGSSHDQAALMKEVAKGLEFEKARERCERTS
jgi:hypothetical protein